MDFFKSMDVYCERVDSTYWSEPVNAISNLGFVLVGLFLLTKLEDKSDKWSVYFILNLIVIGIGSFLFHTHANVWSLFADIIPIMVIVTTFFFYSFKNILKYSGARSSVFTFGIIGLGVYLNTLKLSYFNGSEAYFNVLAGLLFFSFILNKKDRVLSYKFVKATFVFVISLVFRSIDSSVCEAFPLGTHFLWHLNNSFLIYCLISISIYNHKSK